MKLLLSLAIVIAFATQTTAGQIDVDRIGQVAHGSSIGNGLAIGETFTMGRTGRLDNITVALENFTGARVGVQMLLYTTRVEGSSVYFDIKGSSVVTTESSGNWKYYSFPFTATYQAGEELAFTVMPTTGLQLQVMHSDLPGSDLIRSLFGGNWTAPFRPDGSSHSLSFSTSVTPVPEPSTLSLAAISVVALARRRRV